MNIYSRLCLLALFLPAVDAFARRAFHARQYAVSLRETATEDIDEPRMNPDNPNVPELKGDFDWDAKFG